MTTEIPPTTSVKVPVTCSQCRKDLTYTITYSAPDRRHWVLHCTFCGTEEEEAKQRRRQLFANGGNIYIGSYWGPE